MQNHLMPLVTIVAILLTTSAVQAAESVNLTGEWSGDWAYTSYSGLATLAITQNSNEVTGTVTATRTTVFGNGLHTLQGTFDGKILQFTSSGGCNLEGRLEYQPGKKEDVLSGSYTCGPYRDARLRLYRSKK